MTLDLCAADIGKNGKKKHEKSALQIICYKFHILAEILTDHGCNLEKQDLFDGYKMIHKLLLMARLKKM